jgi:hypothetical protein
MGSCFSKNIKHTDRAERRTPKHKEIIAQGSKSHQSTLFPKIIEELRRVSSDNNLHQDLNDVEQSQLLRRLSDKTVRIELEKIARKYGYQIRIEGNTAAVTTAEKSYSL